MSATDCIFCAIIRGDEPSWIIWQDEHHVAFLTPYPNTPGFTVVATRDHLSSYVFDLDDPRYDLLMRAGRRVGHLLDDALDVRRTALIAEGMGIDHAHLKLVPLHGLPKGEWQQTLSDVHSFQETYQGYVSSHDGPRMSDERLRRICQMIRGEVSDDHLPDS